MFKLIAMQVTVEIPDELAAALRGHNPACAVLEALGIEAYRLRGISAFQLRGLLNMSSRWDLDAFLKERRVESYTADDFEHDLATINSSEAMRQAERPT